jgi:hypothetical protein
VSYLLSDWEAAATQARVETAFEALQEFTVHLRQDVRLDVLDDAGQPVSLLHLLSEAARLARDRDALQPLVGVLADYADTHLRPEIEADPPEARWRAAGRSWARDFELPPPQPLLDELARRHPHAHCDEMRQAAEETLPRFSAQPIVSREWGVWDRGMEEWRHVYAHEGVARAHARALNGAQLWLDQHHDEATDAAVQAVLNRRAARARWASQSNPSPTGPTPERPRRPGRQP